MAITTEEFIASAIQEGVVQASIMKIDGLNDALNYHKQHPLGESNGEEEYSDADRNILAQEASDNLEAALQNISE